MTSAFQIGISQIDFLSMNEKSSRRTNRAVRPFLKWAGSKYQILNEILPAIGEGDRLIEPFAGSGAVFLNAHGFKRFLICDLNDDLIHLFKVIKKDPQGFIRDAKKLFTAKNNFPETYGPLRSEFNSSSDKARRAELFVYLNRHGYNGLCRYNSGGGFNVPFGKYDKPYFPERELEHFGEIAQRAVFHAWDFERTIAKAGPHDVVYADPPYVPLSASASFTAYASGGFSIEQQQDLVKAAKAAARRGARVVISNHANDETRKLYKGHVFKEFPVRRSISCVGTKRLAVTELIAIYD